LWNGSLLHKSSTSVSCHDEHGRPMVDLGSEDFEARKQSARAESFAERLRLTYVALTRARAGLWIHWGPVQQGPGYKAEEGLHSSALAWLLHARQPGDDPLGGPEEALSLLRERLLETPHARVRDDLERLVAANPG